MKKITISIKDFGKFHREFSNIQNSLSMLIHIYLLEGICLIAKADFIYRFIRFRFCQKYSDSRSSRDRLKMTNVARSTSMSQTVMPYAHGVGWLVGCVYAPSSRDGTPIYCPLQRT